MPIIERLVVRYDVDPSGATRGMQQAANAVVTGSNRVTRAADGARLNVNKLGNAFGNVAGAMLGIPPVAGRVVDVLGDFFVGGAVTAALLGGLAIAGAAWRNLTSDMKDSEEQAKNTLDELLKLGREARNQEEGKLRVQRVQAEIAKGDLGISIRRLQQAQEEGVFSPERARRIAELQAQQAQLQNVIDRTTDALKGLADKASGSVGELNDQLADLNIKATFATEAVEKMVDEAVFGVQKGGTGLRTLEPALAGGGRVPMDQFIPFRRITSDNLGRGGGATDNSIKEFGLGSELRAKLEELFDARTILSTAAGGLLTGGTSMLFGAITDKLVTKLGSVFGASVEKLEKALQQNTLALRLVSSDVLKARLGEAGLTDEGQAIAKAISATLQNVGLGGPNKILSLFAELEKVGIDTETFKKVAQQLGINLDVVNVEVLQQFLDQLTRAGAGLDDLSDAADSVTEALRNVPSGFKVALARFNATVPAAGTPAASARGITINNVNLPGIRSVREFEDWVRQQAARGGASVLSPSYSRG